MCVYIFKILCQSKRLQVLYVDKGEGVLVRRSRKSARRQATSVSELRSLAGGWRRTMLQVTMHWPASSGREVRRREASVRW